jgi:hypothetical protein
LLKNTNNLIDFVVMIGKSPLQDREFLFGGMPENAYLCISN